MLGETRTVWCVRSRLLGVKPLWKLESCLCLGSGLIDQSQKITVAARAMAERKTIGHLS